MSLILRILIGLGIGALLGLLVPKTTAISILGTLFVGALKAIAPVLVFVLVSDSLAHAKSGNADKFRNVIFLYIFSTLCAAVVAVVMSFLFPLTIELGSAAKTENAAPQGLNDVVTSLFTSVVANPIEALSNANYIGILFWAIIAGIALRRAKDTTKDMMSDFSMAVSRIVKWIINCAPFGILGLVFDSVSGSGLEVFVTYGKLMLLLVCTILIVGLGVNALIVGIALRHNPYPLILRCIKESGMMAFFTRSSAANIPVNLELCKKLQLDEDMYSVSIPLGSTINMNGAAVTITIFSLAAAKTLGIPVSLPMAIVLCVIAALAACGSSGVAGGSLLLVPLGCSLFGISNDIAMQVVGVGFIISVVQDSMETALNSSADVVFTATAEYMQWKKEGRKLPI